MCFFSTFFLLLSFLILSADKISATIDVTPEANINYTVSSRDGNWLLGIRQYKGTIAWILPNMSDPFSFISDDTAGRYSTQPRYHSHGDVTIRVRPDGGTTYTQYSTTQAASGTWSTSITPSPGAFAAFDVTNLLATGHGLNIIREYRIINESLVMDIIITNKAESNIILGSFGVSATFSSNWNNMNLATAAARCSIAEPFISGESGWVKVTRLSGTGRVLLMRPTPDPSTRSISGLQTWRQLKGEDSTSTGYAFEGHHIVGSPLYSNCLRHQAHISMNHT